MGGHTARAHTGTHEGGLFMRPEPREILFRPAKEQTRKKQKEKWGGNKRGEEVRRHDSCQEKKREEKIREERKEDMRKGRGEERKD